MLGTAGFNKSPMSRTVIWLWKFQEQILPFRMSYARTFPWQRGRELLWFVLRFKKLLKDPCRSLRV